MSTTENKTSKYSTNTTKDAAATDNVTHIVDAANENFTKLVNEAGKVQPQYSISHT